MPKKPNISDLISLTRISKHLSIIKSYPFLLPMVLVFMTRIPLDFNPIYNVDEGVMSAGAKIISNGGLPYRDCWDHRGPVMHYIYALVFALFGDNNMVAMHLVTTCIVAVQAFLIFRLSKRLLDSRIALLGACLFAFFSTFGYPPEDTMAANCEIWMNLFILLAFNTFLSALETNGKWHALLAGIFLGVAGLIKQVAYAQFVPFIFIALLVCKHHGSDEPRKNLNMAYLLSLSMCGLLAPLLLTISFYFYHGALTDFARMFLFYNFHYIAMFYGTPESLTLKEVIYYTAGGLRLTLMAIFSLKYTFFLFALVAISPLVLRVRRRISPSSTDVLRGNLVLVFFLVWTIWSLIPLLVLGRAFRHYFLQVLPMACVIASFVIVWFFSESRAPARVKVVSIVAGLFLLSLPPYHFFKKLPRSFNHELDPLVEYVKERTIPTDAVFYYGWESQFYGLVDRPNASRFIFCSFITDRIPGTDDHSRKDKLPGYANTIDLWLDDLRRSKPYYIIDASKGGYFRDYPLSHFGPVWRYIKANYDKVDTLGRFVIYRRNPEPPKGVNGLIPENQMN